MCDHEIENDTCVKCGLIFENFFDTKDCFSKNYPKISTNKVCLLDTVDIPDNVRFKALDNMAKKRISTGKKVRNDSKNTFIEIYNAYLECGINDFDPIELSKKLKLSRKDINWCLKATSGTCLNIMDTNTFTSIVIISPYAYVEPICKKNNLDENIDEIKALVKHILEKKNILYSSRPEYVTCAIIKKYCEKKMINIKSFTKINNISDNALKKTIEDVIEFF